MITDIFNKDTIKILALFSVSPGSKFTRNEIKEKTMLNNVPLDNALNILLNNKTLIKEKRFFSLNFGNKNLKSLLNIVKNEHLRFKEIPLKIYYMLLDISAILSDIRNITKVYLFGSYAKLIYTDKSDVDLAIVLEKENRDTINKIKKNIKKIERKYDKSLELHFFEKKDMRQRDPMIREISRNNVELFDKE
jgi:predicted nucleotidyltransferase